MTKPRLEEHQGIAIVRDDLFPGGTKARFIPQLFDGADEVVYASPCQGGAQYALAFVARELGKRATIFAADRAVPHARQWEAKALGAKIVLIKPGYLNVVQKRASDYAKATGARLAPFGMDLPAAIDVIAAAARALNETPDVVVCSAGSGTLCRSLIRAWPKAHHVAVAVGRDIPVDDVTIDGVSAELIRYDRPFEQTARVEPPVPMDPHYDAKAWEIATARRIAATGRRVICWNVTGPARPGNV